MKFAAFHLEDLFNRYWPKKATSYEIIHIALRALVAFGSEEPIPESLLKGFWNSLSYELADHFFSLRVCLADARHHTGDSK
jgi:hypothetical protein